MTCKVCKREIRIAAKGLCGACYSRYHKRGTTDYAPIRIRGVCAMEGCSKEHVSKGFCDMHYRRLMVTGDPLGTKRPDDWGAKHKHPLFNRWAYAMRHKKDIHPQWQDFLTFVLDIGEPPSPISKLFSADESKPLGPDNFVWKDALTQKADGEDDATYENRRKRAYRKLNPERFKGYDLKKHYGLSKEDYAKMLNDCEHKCAICKRNEDVEIRGKVIRLAVDHCHSSGKIRGLLCASCNRALGGFRDSIDTLKSAIAYLEYHGGKD